MSHSSNDETVDVEVSDVIGILRAAPIRLVKPKVDSKWKETNWPRPEIFYEGSWRSLCRTDMCDDVCTELCANKTDEQWRKHYLAKMKRAFGVRIGPQRFAVIDCATDG